MAIQDQKIITKVLKSVNQFLADEMYLFADHPEFEDACSEIFGVRVMYETSVLICGYDGDAEGYYVTEVFKTGKHWEFSYNSVWFDTKEEALNNMETAQYELKK